MTFRQPDLLAVRFADDANRFQTGATLRGTAVWKLASAPAWLELRLFWYTQGKGTRDVQIVAVQRFEDVPAAGSQEFTFMLPSQVPPSFSGSLISLIWAIELVAPNGEMARAEFVVSPTCQEVRLPAVA